MQFRYETALEIAQSTKHLFEIGPALNLVFVKKSIRGKFLKDIYLEYFVVFGASRL